MGYVIQGTEFDDDMQLLGDVKGANTINAGDGDDHITAFYAGDKVYGGAGDDSIQISSQVAKADGGTGFDLLNFWSSGAEAVTITSGRLNFQGHTAAFAGFEALQIVTGDGNDLITALGGDDFVMAGGGNDTIRGQDGFDLLLGGDGNDTIFGGNDDDQLYGGTENDILYGDDGDDILKGGAGDDFGNGGAGADKLYGADGDDRLYGMAGADRLEGGAGDDELTGGAGADILLGGAGRDVLMGDNGDGLAGERDAFVFTALSDSLVDSPDTIVDFASGQDVIDLSALDANATKSGNQGFTFVGQSDFTAAGQAHVVFDGDWFLEVNVDADLGADLRIELLSRLADAPAPLTVHDLIL
jgi:serralysin